MAETTPLRIHVIPARAAPVAAVLARGPSAWFQVLRWDYAGGTVEPGAWLHGTIYPRRSDVSPDGRLLCCFILTARPAPWDTCYAISKLPWLTALAAWRVGSTYAAPCHFRDDGTLALGFAGPPDRGSYPGALGALPPYPETGASVWTVGNLANELRRGWLPAGSRDAAAAVHVTPVAKGELVLERAQPGGDATLWLVHAGHDVRAGGVEGVEAHYVAQVAGALHLLDDVTWADWDDRGRLLAATTAGALEMRRHTGGTWVTEWRHELESRPDPQEPPAWARRW